MANLIDFKSAIGHVFVPVYYIERSIGCCLSRKVYKLYITTGAFQDIFIKFLSERSPFFHQLNHIFSCPTMTALFLHIVNNKEIAFLYLYRRFYVYFHKELVDQAIFMHLAILNLSNMMFSNT